MIKIVTLLKRRAALPVEDFQRGWRDQYGPLAARLPGLRRYVQSHALLQGYRKGDLLYDGIEEAWFDSREAWRAAGAAPQSALHACAEGLFDATRTVVMPVDVIVAKDGAIPAHAVKNIEFVNRRADLELEAFRRYWREVHGPLAAKIAVIRRYEQNHLSLWAYERPEPAVHDGLAITWFASTQDMKLGASTQAYADTRADEARFLPPGHLPIIITREIEIAPAAAGP